MIWIIQQRQDIEQFRSKLSSPVYNSPVFAQVAQVGDNAVKAKIARTGFKTNKDYIHGQPGG